ncbi:hypothetical protein GCM10027270_21070 [Nocardioides ginkgobilobae]
MTAADPTFLPVSIILGGVQKGASGTLHALLVRHRHVARHGVKERHFFDDDSLDWSAPDYSAYGTVPREDQAGLARRAIDSTPSYFFWPGAMERIAAYDAHLAATGGPEVQLVLCFRDPIERAFSQWTMLTDKLDAKREYPGFGELIRMRTPGVHEVPEGWSKRDARQYSVVSRGLYGAQLRRAMEHLPRERMLLMRFDDVVADPAAALDSMTDFLGLHRFGREIDPRPRNSHERRLDAAPPTGEDLRLLADTYADDLHVFTRLSGLDTSGWATSRILADQLDPAELADLLARKAGLA